jgi:hypothetical protein
MKCFDENMIDPSVTQDQSPRAPLSPTGGKIVVTIKSPGTTDLNSGGEPQDVQTLESLAMLFSKLEEAVALGHGAQIAGSGEALHEDINVVEER